MPEQAYHFKPRARLLLELGRELIRDESIAVLELVKNAYDADSPNVVVELSNIDDVKKGEIKIKDAGSGMDLGTVTGVWLEPGTDYRSEQVKKLQRTPKYKRLPLGQKGIGRFGAHRLGKTIKLITRKEKHEEVVVDVDWSDFEKDTYLDKIPVKVNTREPEVFTGDQTGTQIEIRDLWIPWRPKLVRKIYRSMNAVCSPYDAPESFRAELKLEDADKQDWLEGMLTWQEMLNYKLYNVEGTFSGNKLKYTYKFIPWAEIERVKGRTVNRTVDLTDKGNNKIDLDNFKIGEVKINLSIYDMDSAILKLGVKDVKSYKEFLNTNGGIRVYRDGMRVYDYGEPGNDWLNLGVRRINAPGTAISSNLVLGALSLAREDSSDLIEKTNREGFIENEAYSALVDAITCALSHIETERYTDKERIRAAYNKNARKEPVLGALSDLRTKIKQKVKQKDLKKEFDRYIDRVESDYKTIRSTLLTSAGAGLNLAIVIHEIEKIVKELELAIGKTKGDISRLKTLVEQLTKLTEGYTFLIKKGGMQTVRAGDLIERALSNFEFRFTLHKIKVTKDTDNSSNFKIKCSSRLIVSAIMNLLDNSIWWIENRGPPEKKIYAATAELEDGNAIVIADNGSGFIDDIEDLVKLGVTRKPDGMGMGLYITNEIMKAHNGFIRILESGELKIPKEFDGGIIALIFKGN